MFSRRFIAMAPAVMAGRPSAPAPGLPPPAGRVAMIIRLRPGGPQDTLGRILAQRMGEVLGQQIVIENVGGAGGMTGSLRVAQGAPGGHHLVPRAARPPP